MNVLTSIVRTVAAKLVGGLAGVAASLGVAVPAELSEQATVALSAALFVVAQVVYYVAARWAERRARVTIRHSSTGTVVLEIASAFKGILYRY